MSNSGESTADAKPGSEHLREPSQDDPNRDFQETVGADDARADAVRSGADDDLTGTTRDSEDIPVGRDDARADAERSGADPDAV